MHTSEMYSEDAEKGVLGVVATYPHLYSSVAYLSPDDFYLLRHQMIWRAMQTLIQGGEGINPIAVKRLYQQSLDKAKANGGDDLLYYLQGCVQGAPYPDDVGDFAQEVARQATRRKAYERANNIIALAHRPDVTHNDILSGWREAGEGLHTGAKADKNLGDVIASRLARAEELINNPEAEPGLMTGIKAYDRLINGYQPTDFIVLAGRPGMGKTALMLTMALNQMKAGKQVGFASLEMSADQLTDRLIAMLSGVSTVKVRLPSLMSQTEFHNYVEACAALYQMQHLLRIDDAAFMSFDALRASALRWQHEQPLDVLYVDYLQIIRTKGKENRTVEVGEIAANLKQVARELQIPVIAGAQLSRMVEQRADRRPMLADLRESGGIEQEADVVTMLYRDVYYNEMSEQGNEAELIITKHRNGGTGTAYAYYKAEQTWFCDIQREKVDMR